MKRTVVARSADIGPRQLQAHTADYDDRAGHSAPPPGAGEERPTCSVTKEDEPGKSCEAAHAAAALRATARAVAMSASSSSVA